MNDSLRCLERVGSTRRLAVAAALSAGLLAFGCNNAPDPAAPPAPEVGAGASSVGAAEVRQETSEALDATGEYAKREKDEFVAAARREMDELRTEISLLRERAKGATGEAREELRQEIDEMDAKWRDADLSLERLRTESSQAWREMKEGFSNAMAELKQSYRAAREEFDRS